MVHQLGHGIGQGGAVLAGEQQAVLPGGDDEGVAAIVAGDGGQSQAHALQQGHAGGLGAVGGVELHIQDVQQGGGVRAEAQHLHHVLHPQVALIVLDAGQDAKGEYVRLQAERPAQGGLLLVGDGRDRGHAVHDHGDLFGGDAPLGQVVPGGGADGDDVVGIVLVEQLVHPTARGIFQLGGDGEGGVPAVDHGHMAALGGDAAGQGSVGVDQVGLDPEDEGLKGLHVLAGIGAVCHAVHLVHGDLGLLQQGLEQAAPGDGHQGLELVPVGVAQVI